MKGVKSVRFAVFMYMLYIVLLCVIGACVIASGNYVLLMET